MRKEHLPRLFLLVPLCAWITGVAYYLFEHIWYIPNDQALYGMFLPPRWYGRANDLLTATFSQWNALWATLPVLIGIVYLAFYLGVQRRIRFKYFLAVVYVLAVTVTFLFLLYTPQGLGHLPAQEQSQMNGIWSSMKVLDSTPEFTSANPIGQAQYVYRVLGSDRADFTVLGTTHPPGIFLESRAIYDLASAIVIPGNDAQLATVFGTFVTLINVLVIPLVMLLAKESFGETAARWTGVFLLTVPSVAMHLNSMFDAQGSVFTAAAMVFVAVQTRRLFSEEPIGPKWRDLLCGLGAGFFMTLAAQMTYGHAFVILAILFAFSLVAWKQDRIRLAVFAGGVALPAAAYFVFEYLISAGTSFWPRRALMVVHTVTRDLDRLRPYPTSEFANFVIMSVIGGALFLPVLVYVVGYVVKWVKMLFAGRPVALPRTAPRTFLVLTTFVMFVLLASQTTVRLEVERTWHWFFVPVWSLSGIFILASGTALERVWSDEPPDWLRSHAPLALCFVQLFTTIVLAMCIQDFY